MRNGTFLYPNRETYTLKLLKRDEGNNAFTYGEKDIYEDNKLVNEIHNNYIEFKGRPATNIEKKQNRITKGVLGSNDDITIVCSNLPDIAEIGDKVVYLNKVWTINSIGNLISENKIVNGGIFSEDYILSRSPKTISLG